MIRFFNFIFLFFIGLQASNLWAFDVPALTGPVMDQVGILQPGTQQRLSDELFQFKAKTGVQVQVFIVSSLNDEPIENVSIQIFDKWKLGDAKKDNGLLFLIAPNDRKMRIEVGQGLEGAVPDVIAKRIIMDVVRPYFQQGQFELGIMNGVAAIENYVVTGEGPNLQAEQQSSTRGKIPLSYLGFGALALFIIIFLFSPSLAIHMLLAILSGGRGGGRGGFGGGGGGWSGGGGSSSGGGSSGSW